MMPGDTRASLVEVELVDRERAAEMVAWHNKVAQEWETVNGGTMQFFTNAFPEAIRRGIWDEHEIPQQFARHRLEALRTQGDGEGWQPIETAPAATGTGQDRILIIGGPWAKPEWVLPDGDWWRMRKAQGSQVPTHWFQPPASPTQASSREEG